ncbi:MAG: SRPBCC family protein [Phycisphaerae bacterium]|nr:SRPBCC family protein [Gemmatimonadaceae bacterium]
MTNSRVYAKSAMLIRRPIDDVFGAFINPTVTAKFWFTKGSAALIEGTSVNWEWEMYGVSIPVDVKDVEVNERIVIEWPGVNGPHAVRWNFARRGADATYVAITETGFEGDTDALVRQVANSTEAFALVLSGCKAWLEHGLALGLVKDRFPDGIEEG